MSPLEAERRRRLRAIQRQMDKNDRELRRDVARGHGPMLDRWRGMNEPTLRQPVDDADEGQPS